MQRRPKRLAAWAATLAVALQTILTGLAGGPPTAAASFDPTAVICHSGTPDTNQQTPAPVTQDHCCTQCILCGGLSVANAPDNVTALLLSPERAGAFVPFSSVEPARPADYGFNLPRGPPGGA